MPIHVILGKPGSGKSLYATQRLILELVEGERNVVTNLPLRVARLNEYLQQRYPSINTRLVERLRILTDEEMREFWKYRGPSGEDKGERGVAYFLDEAHIAFNARDWATLGRGALHYLSQHRKLGDIVWPITQAAGNLDKQFRSVAEDFTVLRNEYTAKYGPFRGRGRFVRKTYLSEPTPKAEPFETATFHLDVAGVASCYDTAKGIGVHGSKADMGRRAKGIPIMWVIPGGIALAALCGVIPWLLGKGAQSWIAGDAPAVAETPASVEGTAGAGPSRPVSRPAPSSVVLEGSVSLPGLEWVPDDKPERPLWVNGLITVPGVYAAVAYLSDGRVLVTGDPRFERFDRRGIVYDGRRIWLRPIGPALQLPVVDQLGPQPAAPVVVGDVGPDLAGEFQPLPGFGESAKAPGASSEVRRNAVR